MNKNIPFYLIESFLAAVKGPTLEAAALEIGLTQSALSRQMQLLESLLPQKIFTSQGRKKVLTQYGQTLHDLLLPQFSETQGLIYQADLLHAHMDRARIRLAGRGDLLDSLACRLKSPGQINFMPMGSNQALDALLDRKCDVGIIHKKVNSSELIMKPFFTNHLRIVVPKTLIRNKQLSKKEILDLLPKIPTIVYAHDDQFVAEFLSEFKIDFYTLSISRVYPNFSTILKMLELKVGWAVMPSTVIFNEENFHVFELNERALHSRHFYLGYRKEIKDAPWLKELLEEMKDQF